MVKSPAEVAKIERACQIASRAYAALPGQLSIGMDEHEVARTFRAELTRQGADAIPFMAVTSGAGGYDQIIVGPLERKLASGDVLFIDLGATFDGYFCDFDRNYAVGHADDIARRAYDALFAATDAALSTLKPDMLAPGNRVVATAPEIAQLRDDLAERVRGCTAYLCDEDYLELSGTSMAAAMVSGAVARMLSKDPTLAPATVKAEPSVTAVRRWASPGWRRRRAQPATR